MRDFLKSFLSFGLATSLNKILGLILLPIYTHYFDKTEFGIIDLSQTLITIVSIFGLLQLETSLQRFYYEYNGVRKKLFISNIFLIIAVLSVIVSIIVIILSKEISLWLFKDAQKSNIVVLAILQVPLNNLSMLGLVLLRYEKENTKFLISIIADVVATLLFTYIFVITLKLKIVGVLYAQLGAAICSTAVILFYIKNSLLRKINRAFWRPSFKYALPQFPARIGSLLLSQGSKFFMLSFMSLAAIGLFSVSLRIGSMIQMLYTTFVMAWGPFMFEQFKNKNNKVVFAHTLPIIANLTFSLVAMITLFSGEIFKITISQSYFEGHRLLGGISLYFGLYIIKEAVDIGPKKVNKTKFLSYTFILSLIVNFVSLYVLIQLYNIQGVVMALVITNVFLVIISWIISNKLYHIPYNVWLILGLFIPALLICWVSMYIDFTLLTKIYIALFIVVFYGVCFYFNYKGLKTKIKVS